MRSFILILCLVVAVVHSSTDVDDEVHPVKKSLSLFSVVQFDNDACTTQDTSSTKGVCWTSSECSDKGGTVSGNCASGFGVCCLFTVGKSDCGGTITNNVTYIQNDGFPSAVSTSSTTSCKYTIQGSSVICQIRLDFVSVTLATPSTTSGAVGKCSTDSITATSPSGNYLTPLCGSLTGSHMYFETARQNPAGTLTIATTGSLSGGRTWNIKVTYYECETNFKAPADCLQYLTGLTNSFKSFNFGGLMIRNLQYEVCIRQERGYCRFQLSESSSTTDSFQIDPTSTTTTVSKIGANCDTQFIFVNNGHLASTTNKYCGELLNPVDAETKSGIITGEGPQFAVGVLSANADGETDTTGFDLTYTQAPCDE